MADKPVTREEMYLAYLTGDYTGEIPKPITRKEKYLYELCLKGMGGEVSPEEIKSAVNEYLEKNPVKPGATTEQAQQIEQNKTDIGSLKEETSSLKEDLGDVTFEESGKNLCDFIHPLREGAYINSNNGEINVNQSCNVTKFISVSEGEKYTISSDKYLSVIMCNSNKLSWNTAHTFEVVDMRSSESINASDLTNGYTFTASTPYIILWYPISASYIQVEKGSKKTSYESYFVSKKINSGLIVKERTLAEIEEMVSREKRYAIYDQAYIKNGELVANNDHIGVGSSKGVVAKYTCADVGEKIKTIKCKGKFYANSGSVALVVGNVKYMKSADVSKGAIHVVFTPSNGTVGQCYISYFKNGTNNIVKTVSFNKCMVDGSVEYECGFTLDENVLTVYMPDGTSQSFTDAEFQTLNGKYVLWEHYTTDVTDNNYNHANMTHFYALGIDGAILMDDFLRFDGSIGVAPTGQTYWQFRNGVNYN